MAFEVVWHPSASVDLGEVIGYVCQNFGWTASRKLYEDVMARIDVFSVFPNLGVEMEGVTYQGITVRMMNIHQNAIVYSFDGKQIIIIVFWDNRRNPVRLEKIISSR